MKKAIMEYSEARIRLVKSFQKMTYRIKKLNDDLAKEKFKGLKKEIYLKLRKMDKLLRGVIESELERAKR